MNGKENWGSGPGDVGERKEMAMREDRREFLGMILGTSGAAVLGSLTGAVGADPVPQVGEGTTSLPSPESSGIEHVVVVVMENRSFDHLLGWLPNANGRQAGLTYKDPNGVVHSTYPLAPDYTGCPHPDPDHSYQGARTEYDNGAMDGFLRAGQNDVYCIGYYVETDKPFLSALIRNYTTLDGYFCSILGPTFPNRLFLYAAQTDRLDDSVASSSLPTIWDRLAEAGVSGAYYFSNLPFLALWGLKYLPITRTYQDFLEDAASGKLPAVSFIDPPFTILDDGTGEDDHPHADIRRGDAFMARTFQALAAGPDWNSTVLIFTYDEWGGFFEHVPPVRVVAPNNVDMDQVNGQVLLGLRVPTVVASPFSVGDAAKPQVNHGLYDHTSVLRLIEWRWSLPRLTQRDASSQIGNLANALNFSQPNPTVTSLPLPSPPSPAPCFSNLLGLVSIDETRGTKWWRFMRSGLLKGWERVGSRTQRP
jgi:phospholipase C